MLKYAIFALERLTGAFDSFEASLITYMGFVEAAGIWLNRKFL